MNIQRHGRLVESQANLIEFEQLFQELQRQRVAAEAEFKHGRAEEKRQRRIVVRNWFSAAGTDSDQVKGLETRKAYPGSGCWLLKNNLMQAWINPEFCSIPLLWVNGIPGAGTYTVGFDVYNWSFPRLTVALNYIPPGKTVLASVVIEESQRLRKEHPIFVVFFYCKHRDPKRDNFTAVIRGMLVQILQQDDSLLPYLYEKASLSGEPVLESLTLAKELLETALKSLEKVYVIIDGIDECEKNERERIIMWFRSTIDSLPANESESLRCLFLSQDDGVIGKLLSKTPVIRISLEDTSDDIRRYTTVWSQKIQARFGISDADRKDIAAIVAERAKGKIILHCISSVANDCTGMFLFAKLVMENLHSQTRLAKLKRELEPGRFPCGLEDAYVFFSPGLGVR